MSCPKIGTMNGASPMSMPNEQNAGNIMLLNFEEITQELSDDELRIIPLLIKGFKRHSKGNPIKAPEIVRNLNQFLSKENIKLKMTEARLRKCCNYIRSNGMIPLIATSEGYYVSYDVEIIKGQIQSLEQRAGSIKKCAEGLGKFINGDL